MIGMMGQLSPGQALSVVKQVCEGLAEAHKLGVVHRDLKPSNIMIDREGNARIMDFGIARSLKAKGITRTGTMIGTPEYMSPEQVEGLETDQRSDIYSLGVILYEMVAGRIPFDGETPFSIALKHKSEIPQDPTEINPQIPENISRLIMRCLEKDREKRYQTAGELRELIQDSLVKKLIRLHHHLMGMIELERENYPKSIDYFKKAIPLLPYTRDGRREFRALFIDSLAEAYYKAGSLTKALEEYKRIASLTYSRIWDGDIYAKSFYMMGRIYESMGKKAEATEAYGRFLELWKDADPGILEVIDARKRLGAI